jgi:molecular chaperone GrpE
VWLGDEWHLVIEGDTVSQQVENANTSPHAESQVAPENTASQEPGKIPPRGDENLQAEVSLVEHDNLVILQKQLEQALAEAEENRNLYLSARAEMENIRKRGERELQTARKFILRDFVEALLPVKDSLERGIVAVSNEMAEVNKLREGSELTLKMLVSVLERFGVQEINPIGEKFNPDLHQAMAVQPSEEVESNTVLQVAQKGYLLNERLIRPAMVIVAQAVKKVNSTIENPPNDPK